MFEQFAAACHLRVLRILDLQPVCHQTVAVVRPTLPLGNDALEVVFTDRLEEIEWDEFFRKFEESDLAFLHQDRTGDGKLSRFHKFVRRSSE